MPLPDRLPEDFATQTANRQVLKNRYVLGKRLGAGNFGTAYLVEDENPVGNEDREKVLKQIHVGPLDPGETVSAMREAQLLSRLQHRNIVQFNESFLDGPFFCIITEFCNEGDLDVKLKEYKDSESTVEEVQVVDWLGQLLRALDYMHGKRILHRDLKTKNIFLKNNEIKIGDFGISRILMGTADKASTFVGTPYYMSPEVLQHENYDEKCDMWSLGCVLYEMCCLKHAFEGISLMAVMFKIVEGNIPELPDTYSEPLHAIFHEMLVRDIAKRKKAKEILQHDIFKETNFKSERSEKLTLTPKERLKRKKQKEADEKFRKHKELAEKNFILNKGRHKESVTRNFHHTSIESSDKNQGDKVVKSKPTRRSQKKKQSDTKNYDDVFDDERTLVPTGSSEKSKPNAQGAKTMQHYRGEKYGVHPSLTMPVPRSSDEIFHLDGDATLQGTVKDIPLFDGESTDELTKSLIKDGYIPEDADLAETYYSLHSDFEEFDSSDLDIESDLDLPDDHIHLSDTEYKDMLELMQEALGLDDSTAAYKQKPKNGKRDKGEDDGASSALAHNIVDGQIANMKKSCLDAMGQEVFDEAYKYLRSIWSNHVIPSAPDYTMAMQQLQNIVQDDNKCFLLEQLVYLENEKAIQGY